MKRFKILNKTLDYIDKIIDNHVKANHILIKKHVIAGFFTKDIKEKLTELKEGSESIIRYFKKNNISKYEKLKEIDTINKESFFLLIKETSETCYEEELNKYLQYQSSFLKNISDFKSHIIEYQNQHDQLTLLPLRKLMFKNLESLVSDNKNFYIAFIDIDHFKNINDIMGYDKGDEALISVTKMINEHLDKGILYRYGGEEFVMIIPHTDIEKIMDIFNLIYADIRDYKISNNNDTIDVTITTGITQFNYSRDIRENIGDSSELMQKAKKDGRNRVYILGDKK